MPVFASRGTFLVGRTAPAILTQTPAQNDTLLYDTTLGAFTNIPASQLVNQNLEAGTNIFLSTDINGKTIISASPTSASTIQLVADIPARDALLPTPGQEVYVIDTGYSEWGLYMWDGSTWKQLATQNSSTVDARTLHTTLSFSQSTGNVFLGNLSGGTHVVEIELLVST